ncbi:hypothetical protein MOC96_00255 [Bacillus vallismortis]|uniref:hypothetical protein n=1 Tax=Bacillus vallismortis TaxID=72361 RepID=UPI00227E574B|nr:hypothetical protein [Bacillus vallismortis]MCY8307186.1 hypothetical protein [Bacillus vallismortis]
MYILIKFLRPEHVSGFLNGSLFFMNIGYFIDLEKNNSESKGIGDQYEGSQFRILDNKKDMLSIKIDGKYHKIPFKRGFATESNLSARQLLLSCFTLLEFNSNNFYQDDTNKNENIYKIKPEILEGLEKEFKGRVPILMDAQIFIERFEEKIKKNLYRRGMVKYFDEYSNYPLTKDQIEKDPIQTVFCKRKFYEHQKEFRIVLANPSGLESSTIELGDLRDFTMQLKNIQDLNTLSFKEEKLTEEHSV